MTITDLIPATVTFDLYRDIHKGIRSELFAVVGTAGCLDPADAMGRSDLARQIGSLATFLEQHAEHEDGAIQPVLEQLLPSFAEQVEVDHLALERRLGRILERAEEAVVADAHELRAAVGWVYLDLASFTSAYLAHQDMEERDIMPALESAIGPEATLGIHQAIVGNIPPDEMARALAIMLPSMNVDDRTELLAGMRADAPAEAFQAMWGLAGSVLEPRDLAAVGARLGL